MLGKYYFGKQYVLLSTWRKMFITLYELVCAQTLEAEKFCIYHMVLYGTYQVASRPYKMFFIYLHKINLCYVIVLFMPFHKRYISFLTLVFNINIFSILYFVFINVCYLNLCCIPYCYSFKYSFLFPSYN